MAINQSSANQLSYGFNNPLQKNSPAPVVVNRAPTTSDFADLGTLWIYPATDGAWVLTSITANSANWLSL